MNEDTLNMEVRRFLKKVGITSQREIEQAVREAEASGRLKGVITLPVQMTLDMPALGIHHCIDGSIDLD